MVRMRSVRIQEKREKLPQTGRRRERETSVGRVRLKNEKKKSGSRTREGKLGGATGRAREREKGGNVNGVRERKRARECGGTIVDSESHLASRLLFIVPCYSGFPRQSGRGAIKKEKKKKESSGKGTGGGRGRKSESD